MNPNLLDIDPAAWLRRDVTAEALKKAGYPTAEATLASLATRGGGPPFRINGRTAEYQWGPTLEWRKARVRYRSGIPGEAAQPQRAA